MTRKREAAWPTLAVALSGGTREATPVGGEGLPLWNFSQNFLSQGNDPSV